MLGCFARELGIHVDDKVILRDPNENVIVVDVDKKCHKVYLRNGWLRLKNIYDIRYGTLMTLTYVRPNLLLLRIKDKAGVEITYPRNPALTIPRYISTAGMTYMVHFYRTTVKILTSSDISLATWYHLHILFFLCVMFTGLLHNVLIMCFSLKNRHFHGLAIVKECCQTS